MWKRLLDLLLKDISFKTTPKKTVPVQKKRYLSISTQYKYPASNLPASESSDVSQLYKDVTNLPQMRHAHVSVCEVDKGTLFTGFNKPKKVLRHIVVYPNEAAEKDRANLLKVAQKNNLSVALLTSNKENQCIRVAKDKHVFFLIKPTSVKLHSWVYKPSQSNETTAMLSKKGVANLCGAVKDEITIPKLFTRHVATPEVLNPSPVGEQTLLPRRRR